MSPSNPRRGDEDEDDEDFNPNTVVSSSEASSPGSLSPASLRRKSSLAFSSSSSSSNAEVAEKEAAPQPKKAPRKDPSERHDVALSVLEHDALHSAVNDPASELWLVRIPRHPTLRQDLLGSHILLPRPTDPAEPSVAGRPAGALKRSYVFRDHGPAPPDAPRPVFVTRGADGAPRLQVGKCIAKSVSVAYDILFRDLSDTAPPPRTYPKAPQGEKRRYYPIGTLPDARSAAAKRLKLMSGNGAARTAAPDIDMTGAPGDMDEPMKEVDRGLHSIVAGPDSVDLDEPADALAGYQEHVNASPVMMDRDKPLGSDEEQQTADPKQGTPTQRETPIQKEIPSQNETPSKKLTSPKGKKDFVFSQTDTVDEQSSSQRQSSKRETKKKKKKKHKSPKQKSEDVLPRAKTPGGEKAESPGKRKRDKHRHDEVKSEMKLGSAGSGKKKRRYKSEVSQEGLA